MWICLDYNNRKMDNNNIESVFLHFNTFHKPISGHQS